MIDLISRSALKEKLSECGYDIADFGGLFFIIDNAPAEDFSKEICSSCGRYIREKEEVDNGN